MKVSRRALITGGIVLGGGAALIGFGKTPFRRFAANYAAGMELPSGIFNFAPDFWFEVGEQVVLKAPKAEMGQDIFTGFALLVAEELDITPESLIVRPGSTHDSAADLAGTGGSGTTASLYKPLRVVAATLRETLKLAAAKQWGVPIDAIRTIDGDVISGERRASYGEIAAAAAGGEWEIADEPELRPEASFRYVGKPHPRLDLRAKVLGEPIYAFDAELPGMVWASVLRSPYIGGTLKSLDVAAAEAFPGVERVIQEGDLVAVVASGRYAAEMGKRYLQAEWEVPRRWNQAEIDALVRVDDGPAVNLQNDGDAVAVLRSGGSGGSGDGGVTVVEAEYRTPLGAHAHMEPNGMLVEIGDEKAVIITGTQLPVRVQEDAAAALGWSKDRVEVRNRFLGGGFGRRYFKNNAAEAVRIARIVGKPVHMFMDREEEFRNGYLRPNAHHVLRGSCDAEGRILALEHRFASGDMMLDQKPLSYLKPALGADWIAAGHGFHIHYDAPHRRVDMQQRELPFPTGIWRSVGMFTNLFAVESFIDELAAAAGIDPLEMRLRNLVSADPIVRRLRAALETAAERSGWHAPRAAGVGWGVACAEDRNTVAAAVVRVRRVDMESDGESDWNSESAPGIRVEHVTQVLDPGKIIHPEGVRAQVEGATLMALSATLYEEIRVVDGQLHATNFHQYPVATLRDAPEIDVVLLEGADHPSGVGEPPMAPIAPAIANAVWGLTGERWRNLPPTPSEHEFSSR